MGEVVELPNRGKIKVVFYEVSDAQKLAIWGGESPSEALKWYRNSPIDSKIWVQEWITDEDEARPASDQIEITSIVLSTIADCMERWS